MSEVESPVVFECAGECLVGVLHPGQAKEKTGVVIVVGGPQYRVGSHRQFVHMARRIAAAGYPVLRFDYRGMGDSDGAPRSFEVVNEDIRTAIDRIFESAPGLTKIVLLGLCDAASAILMYCLTDSRVGGLILQNPWVRTKQGEAESYIRHYYLRRLLQRSLWRKVFSGKYEFFRSLRDFWQSVTVARINANDDSVFAGVDTSFIDRMQRGLKCFEGPVLVLISGRDLTAQEFLDLRKRSKTWKGILKRSDIETTVFPFADHTMSTRVHLDEATDACVDWLGGRLAS